jgi:hypothetical protein
MHIHLPAQTARDVTDLLRAIEIVERVAQGDKYREKLHALADARDERLAFRCALFVLIDFLRPLREAFLASPGVEAWVEAAGPVLSDEEMGRRGTRIRGCGRLLRKREGRP